MFDMLEIEFPTQKEDEKLAPDNHEVKDDVNNVSNNIDENVDNSVNFDEDHVPENAEPINDTVVSKKSAKKSKMKAGKKKAALKAKRNPSKKTLSISKAKNMFKKKEYTRNKKKSTATSENSERK